MDLITKFKMVDKNKRELRSLLRSTFQEMTRSESNTHKPINFMSATENIKREVSSRAKKSSMNNMPLYQTHGRIQVAFLVSTWPLISGNKYPPLVRNRWLGPIVARGWIGT